MATQPRDNSSSHATAKATSWGLCNDLISRGGWTHFTSISETNLPDHFKGRQRSSQATTPTLRMTVPITISSSGISRPNTEWRLTAPLTPQEIKRTEAHFMPYDAGDALLPCKLAYANECEEAATRDKAEALTMGKPFRPMLEPIQPKASKVCSRRQPPVEKSTATRTLSASVPMPAFVSPETEGIREKVPVVEEPVTATEASTPKRKSSGGRLLSNLLAKIPPRRFTKSKAGEKATLAQPPTRSVPQASCPPSAAILNPLTATPKFLTLASASSSTPAPACSPLTGQDEEATTEAFPAFEEDLSMEGLSREPSCYVDVYHPEWRATVAQAVKRVEKTYEWVGRSKVDTKEREKKTEREEEELKKDNVQEEERERTRTRGVDS